ncbi:hypothetical protein Tco_0270197 [Tanacetum coccineum]
MRADELYKFSDGTLKTVRDELHHRILDFRLGYNDEMSRRKWTTINKKRSELMVELIDKQTDDSLCMIVRFNNNDTVDMLYDGSKWKWPSEWTQKYLVLLFADRICLEKGMKINWKTDTWELKGCLDVGIKEKGTGLDGIIEMVGPQMYRREQD